MTALLPAIAPPSFDRIRGALARLSSAPPQSLLLEGGTEAQRQDAARYWAACLHCPQAAADAQPCLLCPVCQQIAAGEYLDLAAYDGRISNADDTDAPGLVRALTIENIRELKKTLRDKPHSQAPRVILLSGLENLQRSSAVNALLKALEEPSPFSVFTLLTAQREQILPTLVSRSLCLTLPWPDSRGIALDMQPWLDSLADFLRNEHTSEPSLLERTATKGALDQAAAKELLLCCQKILLQALAGESVDAPLFAVLSRLDAGKSALACRWFAEAQQALAASVTPARVVEALAMRLFVLLRQKAVT